MTYRWHYLLSGNPTAPPLLLLHGWLGSCEDYRESIDLLADRFYCIAIDLPGHGNTAVIGTDDRAYGFAPMAAGIIQLLIELNIDRPHLSGYSFGGRLALYLWLHYPQSFSGLVLESASCGLADAAARSARIIGDDRIIARLQTTPLREFLLDWYAQPLFQGMSPSPQFDRLLNRRLTNSIDGAAKSLRHAGLGRQPYLGDALARDNRPIHLLVGEFDRKFIDIARSILALHPHSTLEIVPNCAHNIHYQQPLLWARSIANFLSN
jgi:2-succinyl-6-hydroxy-2,4-cyclohexadiene-1-carboxylate synthase